MKAQQIIRLANDIKSVWKTSNPFEIAEKYGIRVLIRNVNIDNFKAQTLKMEGYPTIISINGLYSTLAQRVLCAHELGHALLHTEYINHFDVTTKNVHTNVEYEANLFAVALLCDEADFNMPLSKMSGAVLKGILDYNVKGKDLYEGD
jgi:Zn-dependent peptidase ImmA (M78 family)